MSVLDREALEQSPLADLHAIASELSIDSYRLLRREQLVDAILARQEGTDGAEESAAPTDATVQTGTAPPEAPKPRRRRGRQQRTAARVELEQAEPEPTPDDEAGAPASGPAEPESGDAAADAIADRARFEALTAKFPDEPLAQHSDDPTVAAIASLTPIGKGSRVTIAGPARAGKTEALRRIALALHGRDDLRLHLLLVGVRPEEIGEWEAGTTKPVQALSFGAPTSAQDRAVYAVIDEVRAAALRGEDAVVLLDTLDGLHEHAARRAIATARNLADGGSVTLIATASEAQGGETTVVALDPALAGAGRYPALDLRASGTMRAELLVGEEGAQRIARERADLLAATADAR